MRKQFFKHFNNLLLLVLSGGFFWLGASFLEYEFAKWQKKGFVWIETPRAIMVSVSMVMIFSSILILSILVIIYYKKLENRRLLWLIILTQAISLILISAFLGYNKFIWVLFPSTFSIFK